MSNDLKENESVVQNPENHRGKLGGVAVCCVATGFIPVVLGIPARHDQSPRPAMCLTISLADASGNNFGYNWRCPTNQGGTCALI